MRQEAQACTHGASTTTPTSSASWSATSRSTTTSRNEEAIAEARHRERGSSGFDIVVPTGSVHPADGREGPAEKFDKSPASPTSSTSTRCTSASRGIPPTTTRSARTGAPPAGSTTPRSSPSESPAGRTSSRSRRARPAATARCSTLRPTSPASYFWANGIDWTTEDTADLDACEDVPRQRVRAAHQGVRLVSGHRRRRGRLRTVDVRNGDARQASDLDRGGGRRPVEVEVGLGAPATELWMDN